MAHVAVAMPAMPIAPRAVSEMASKMGSTSSLSLMCLQEAQLDPSVSFHAEEIDEVEFMACSKSWISFLTEQMMASKQPRLLVTVETLQAPDGASSDGESKQSERQAHEKVHAVNKAWLDLCEYEEGQIIGKPFSEIEGFQGPLTSGREKLSLTDLLMTEKPRETGLNIVSRCGDSGRSVEMTLDMDVLRFGNRNLAFLCTVAEHRVIGATRVRSRPASRWGRRAETIPGALRMAAGSAGRAASALRLISADRLRSAADILAPRGPRSGPPAPRGRGVRDALIVEAQEDAATYLTEVISPVMPLAPRRLSSSTATLPMLPNLWQILLEGHSSQTTAGNQVWEDSKGLRMDGCILCLSSWRKKDRVRVLPCGHAFHRRCVDARFAQQLDDDVGSGESWVPAAFNFYRLQPRAMEFLTPLCCPVCKQDPTLCGVAKDPPLEATAAVANPAPAPVCEPCGAPTEPTVPTPPTQAEVATPAPPPGAPTAPPQVFGHRVLCRPCLPRATEPHPHLPKAEAFGTTGSEEKTVAPSSAYSSKRDEAFFSVTSNDSKGSEAKPIFQDMFDYQADKSMSSLTGSMGSGGCRSSGMWRQLS